MAEPDIPSRSAVAASPSRMPEVSIKRDTPSHNWAYCAICPASPRSSASHFFKGLRCSMMNPTPKDTTAAIGSITALRADWSVSSPMTGRSSQEPDSRAWEKALRPPRVASMEPMATLPWAVPPTPNDAPGAYPPVPEAPVPNAPVPSPPMPDAPVPDAPVPKVVVIATSSGSATPGPRPGVASRRSCRARCFRSWPP